MSSFIVSNNNQDLARFFLAGDPIRTQTHAFSISKQIFVESRKKWLPARAPATFEDKKYSQREK